MTEYNLSELIASAWCDKTTWTDIKSQYDLTEDEVMKIMKYNLKKRSYIVWRERVRRQKNKINT